MGCRAISPEAVYVPQLAVESRFVREEADAGLENLHGFVPLIQSNQSAGQIGMGFRVRWIAAEYLTKLAGRLFHATGPGVEDPQLGARS